MKHRLLKLSLLALSLALTTGELAQAQSGISPSMNSQFLNELRARSPKHAEEGRDELGSDRLALDKGRALSRPELFSSTNQENQRLVGDITGFNSQYQMGRKFLTPFYNGVVGLEDDVSNKSAFKSNFALQQTFEYNSRVNFGKGGVIFSPMVLADVSYQISPNQSLSFKGGIGLSWISGNDHIDGSYFSDEFLLNVLPGTSLVYYLELGALHVTAYDRVSVKQFVGMLQNDLGIAGTLELTEQLSWTVNYNFSKTYDIDGNYGGRYSRGFNADIHTVSSMLAFQSKGSWSAGLEGSLNWYRPEDNPTDLSPGGYIIPQAEDGFLASAGAFVQIMINKDTRLRVAAGYQHQSFDGPDQAINFLPFLYAPATSPDINQPYYSVSLSQKISESLSHELSLGYETNLQRAFNIVSAHFINYGITSQVWKGGQLTGSAYYEYADYAEAVYPLDLTSYGLDLHFSQRLTDKLSASAAYSFSYGRYKGLSTFDYSPLNVNYRQNMAGLSLDYAISTKTLAQLSWQGFYNNGAFQGTTDHHRVALSLRVQF
ncbi:MAG: hypothetical protein NTV80_02560 [Verrucomicrobia bacterium]|nr:hypothetical protein [Verrucomicrobiota bacterium]